MLGALALVAASCGGSGDSDASGGDDLLEGELVTQGDIALDADAVVTTTTIEPAADGGGGAGEADGAAEDGAGVGDDGSASGFEATDDTIPLNESDDGDDPSALFSAMRVFNDCLADEGRSFIGQPDPSLEADDPVNDPEYLDALQKCAGVSNIVEAFNSFQSAQENLDQDEIEERNRGLVDWADCMRGRGWVIDDLVADDRGLLQPEGLTPPAGENLLGSDDLEECAALAQAENAADDTDEGSSE